MTPHVYSPAYSLIPDFSAFNRDVDALCDGLSALRSVDLPEALAQRFNNLVIDIPKLLDELFTIGEGYVAVGTEDLVVPVQFSERGRDYLAALRALQVEAGVLIQHGGSSQETEA